MGRYVRGNDGFEYKYVFGEQPSNLAWLAGRSGAGTASMVFDYFVEDEDGEEAQFGDGDPEVKGLGPAADGGFISPMRGLNVEFEEDTPHEVVGHAINRAKDELLDRLRAGVAKSATGIRMEAYADYELAEKDRSKLLDWISRYLPNGKSLTLDQIESLDEDALYETLDESKSKEAEYLPLLALCILAHALKDGASKASFHDDAEWDCTLWPPSDDDDDDDGDEDDSDEDDGDEDEDDNPPAARSKAQSKKQPAKNRPAKPAKKRPAKNRPAKPAKKRPAKKPPAKKRPAKPAKKRPSKPAKKRPAKKGPAKKRPAARKAAAKKGPRRGKPRKA